MASYLNPKKRSKGEGGGNKAKKYFLNGLAKLKRVIEDIEGLDDDSTLATLRERIENGETSIPTEDVNEMLRKIRGDLVDAEHDLIYSQR